MNKPTKDDVCPNCGQSNFTDRYQLGDTPHEDYSVRTCLICNEGWLVPVPRYPIGANGFNLRD